MIKKHIRISVDIPTTDVDNRLKLEPGTGDIVILSEGSGLKIGVDAETLINAIYELKSMKRIHLPEEEKVEEIATDFKFGEIIEGDEE